MSEVNEFSRNIENLKNLWNANILGENDIEAFFNLEYIKKDYP